MNEQREKKIKGELIKFFRTNFTYYGLNAQQCEDRVYKLVDDMFRIFVANEGKGGKGPEKLPTHIG